MRQIFIACALFLSSASPLAAYDFSKITEKPKAVTTEAWNKAKHAATENAQKAKEFAVKVVAKGKEFSGAVVEKIKGIFSRLQKKEKISIEEKKQELTPGVTVGDVVKAAENALSKGDKRHSHNMDMAPRFHKNKQPKQTKKNAMKIKK